MKKCQFCFNKRRLCIVIVLKMTFLFHFILTLIKVVFRNVFVTKKSALKTEKLISYFIIFVEHREISF